MYEYIKFIAEMVLKHQLYPNGTPSLIKTKKKTTFR